MFLECFAESSAVLEFQEFRYIIDFQIRIGQKLLRLRQTEIRGILRDGLLCQLLEEVGSIRVADVERGAEIFRRHIFPGLKLVIDIFRHQEYRGICLYDCGLGMRGRVKQGEEADGIAYDVRLDRQVRIVAGKALEGFLEQHIGQLGFLLRRWKRKYAASFSVKFLIQNGKITQFANLPETFEGKDYFAPVVGVHIGRIGIMGFHGIDNQERAWRDREDMVPDNEISSLGPELEYLDTVFPVRLCVPLIRADILVF